MRETYSDVGHVFPPRDEWDVLAYDPREMMEGFLEGSVDDPSPGPNRPPAYRWGWANRIRDLHLQPDGFEPIRDAVMRELANRRQVA